MLLLAPIVIFCAEVYVIVLVAGLVGAGPTVLLLAVGFVVGSALLRRQGRASWRRFVEATASGELPHRAVLDGVLLVLAGVLLVFPGFLTDIAAFLLLLAPTRALARRLLLGTASRRWRIVRVAANRPRRHAEGPADVEGTATEHQDDPARHLPR